MYFRVLNLYKDFGKVWQTPLKVIAERTFFADRQTNKQAQKNSSGAESIKPQFCIGRLNIPWPDFTCFSENQYSIRDRYTLELHSSYCRIKHRYRFLKRNVETYIENEVQKTVVQDKGLNVQPKGRILRGIFETHQSKTTENLKFYRVPEYRRKVDPLPDGVLAAIQKITTIGPK